MRLFLQACKHGVLLEAVAGGRWPLLLDRLKIEHSTERESVEVNGESALLVASRHFKRRFGLAVVGLPDEPYEHPLGTQNTGYTNALFFAQVQELVDFLVDPHESVAVQVQRGQLHDGVWEVEFVDERDALLLSQSLVRVDRDRLGKAVLTGSLAVLFDIG